ncbi:MAG: type II toxin-antitoxin system PemK/MazF family toxin [Gemmataceae bacterium]
MSFNRGDIVLTRVPHAGGTRGKKRPGVVIQADVFNAQFQHLVVAEITKNLAAASNAAGFLIDVSLPEGAATGLNQNSAVCCLFLTTVSVGKLSDAMRVQLDNCLKAALQIG